MSTIQLQEFQHHALAILLRAEAGESIVVARGDVPVAELRPVPSVRSVARPFGLAAGEFVVPANFDSPLPEDLLSEFEGR